MLNLSLSQDLPPSCDCTVTETSTGSALVLSVTGALDMLTANTLQEAVDAALGQHPASLVVDLSGVTFLASHGMNVLVAAHFEAGSETSVIVVADGPVTARPLALVGISDIITMYPTLDEALSGVVAALVNMLLPLGITSNSRRQETTRGVPAPGRFVGFSADRTGRCSSL